MVNHGRTVGRPPPKDPQKAPEDTPLINYVPKTMPEAEMAARAILEKPLLENRFEKTAFGKLFLENRLW